MGRGQSYELGRRRLHALQQRGTAALGSTTKRRARSLLRHGLSERARSTRPGRAARASSVLASCVPTMGSTTALVALTLLLSLVQSQALFFYVTQGSQRCFLEEVRDCDVGRGEQL